MVFVIQNTNNRDSQAVNLKLDEIIRVISKANNTIIGAEKLPERDIKKLIKNLNEQIAAKKTRGGKKKRRS